MFHIFLLNRELNSEKQTMSSDKQNNRIISGLRIIVEHAIGGMKRFKAASDIYRNRIPNTDDTFSLYVQDSETFIYNRQSY